MKSYGRLSTNTRPFCQLREGCVRSGIGLCGGEWPKTKESTMSLRNKITRVQLIPQRTTTRYTRMRPRVRLNVYWAIFLIDG